MPLPDDFATYALYDERAWFLSDVRFEPEHQRVIGTCDTTRLGEMVDAQRVLPNHPKHFPGAVAIQVTGTLGQLYPTYVLDLKSTEGWVGFGTHIHDARFKGVGKIGPPVTCTAELVTRREVWGTLFTRFKFTFEQEGSVIFRSEQTAAWVKE